MRQSEAIKIDIANSNHIDSSLINNNSNYFSFSFKLDTVSQTSSTSSTQSSSPAQSSRNIFQKRSNSIVQQLKLPSQTNLSSPSLSPSPSPSPTYNKHTNKFLNSASSTVLSLASTSASQMSASQFSTSQMLPQSQTNTTNTNALIASIYNNTNKSKLSNTATNQLQNVTFTFTQTYLPKKKKTNLGFGLGSSRDVRILFFDGYNNNYSFFKQMRLQILQLSFDENIYEVYNDSFILKIVFCDKDIM